MRRIIALHFLPSYETASRGKLLSHRALTYYVLLVFSVFVSLKAITHSTPGILGYASSISVSELLGQTNQNRQKKNLPSLTLNGDLSSAAAQKAKNMFEDDYWAHISPKGVEPWHFFDNVGYDYLYAGENLARNFNDSKGVVRAWMNSPSHRENLLNPNFEEVGFAVVNGRLDGYETTLVVQFLGKRRVPVAASVGKAKSETAFEESEELVQEVAGSKAPEPSIAVGQKLAQNPTLAPTAPISEPVLSIPLIEISAFTKVIALLLASFVVSLLLLDLAYSSRKGILKLTGHTLAHALLFIMVIICIGFVLSPGRLI